MHRRRRYGFCKYYSLPSDLCADVYGLRNLIVQMGHKDDVAREGEVAHGVCLSQLFQAALLSLSPSLSRGVFLRLRTFRR